MTDCYRPDLIKGINLVFMDLPSGDQADIMRRRAVIRDTLSAAGLVIASGVIDSAARLDPVHAAPANQAREAAEMEAAVHAHALDFPTVPTVDQLPTLLRDYVAGHRVSAQVGLRRTYSSMAYLAAFIGANLASWQEYAQAMLWYRKALSHATQASDRAATG
ncbi:MAG: hypothetical protein ACRD0H_28080, partial [Actinomycetes bacterium]